VERGKTRCESKRHKTDDKRNWSNLRALFRDSIKDGFVCAVGIAGLCASFLVILVALGESLWSEIVGIAKRLMDALESVPASHKNLML
jgi:hypothetical protein